MCGCRSLRLNAYICKNKMMPLRSRYQKRYLLAIISVAAFLLIINTELQVSTFQSYYTIEISRSSVPFTLVKVDNSTQNVPVDDERLINYIQGLFEYGSGESDYNLSNDRLGDRSRGQAAELDVYLKYKVCSTFLIDACFMSIFNTFSFHIKC